jgi:protein-disulfide isomerase
MVKLRTREPAGLVGLAALLVVVMLAVGACAQPAPVGPAATTAPAQATAAPTSTAPATSAPTNTPASKPSAASNLPAGVNAEGDFYRGDPNAPVKLVEFSDFQ